MAVKHYPPTGEFGIVFRAQLLNSERWASKGNYSMTTVAVKTLKGTTSFSIAQLYRYRVFVDVHINELTNKPGIQYLRHNWTAWIVSATPPR